MNPDIKSVSDLKGKTVSVGALGSGVYFNALDVFAAYDMTLDDISPVYQSFGDSAESLKDKKIDAAFIVAGAPTTAITDLSTSGQVYLVAIDDEHVDKLIAASPYYSAYTVTADTYGMPEDVQTVAVAAVGGGIIADGDGGTLANIIETDDAVADILKGVSGDDNIAVVTSTFGILNGNGIVAGSIEITVCNANIIYMMGVNSQTAAIKFTVINNKIL